MIKYLALMSFLLLAIDVQAQQMPSPGGVELGSVVPKKLLSKPTPSGKAYTLTLPKPNSFVANSIVRLNGKGQAIKIVIIGKNHSNDSYGSFCKSEYEDTKQALTEKYGSPTGSFDRLAPGSVWEEPRDFVMSLYKNEYVKADYWTNDLGFAIELRMEGISTDDCYNAIEYEHSLLFNEEIARQEIKEKEGF